MAAAYPFPYLHHGEPAPAAGVVRDAYLAFQQPVPAEQRPTIRRGCPALLDAGWAWGTSLVACMPSADLAALSADARSGFAADVEAWARAVHAAHPLAFFVGPVYVDPRSAWGEHSERVLPGIMIPFLETYAAENATDFVEDEAPGGAFGTRAMAGLLREIPKTPDRELNQRLDRLRARFGLGPKGTMVILPT